jgi:hypothetical protein
MGYQPNPESEFRVKFDFRVDFTNGGYLEGHDFSRPRAPEISMMTCPHDRRGDEPKRAGRSRSCASASRANMTARAAAEPGRLTVAGPQRRAPGV